MNLSTLKSGAAAPFAALFGRSAKSSAKRAEGDDDKKKDDDKKDDDKESKSKAEGDEPEKKKDKDDDKSKKGEDDKKDPECAEDDEEEEKAEARGQKAERTRWTSVLASAEAVGRGESACMLLSTTELNVGQITKVLSTIQADTKGGGLSDRMRAVTTPNPGTGEETEDPSNPRAVGAAITAVYSRAIGKRQA